MQASGLGAAAVVPIVASVRRRLRASPACGQRAVSRGTAAALIRPAQEGAVLVPRAAQGLRRGLARRCEAGPVGPDLREPGLAVTFHLRSPTLPVPVWAADPADIDCRCHGGHRGRSRDVWVEGSRERSVRPSYGMRQSYRGAPVARDCALRVPVEAPPGVEPVSHRMRGVPLPAPHPPRRGSGLVPPRAASGAAEAGAQTATNPAPG